MVSNFWGVSLLTMTGEKYFPSPMMNATASENAVEEMEGVNETLK